MRRARKRSSDPVPIDPAAVLRSNATLNDGLVSYDESTLEMLLEHEMKNKRRRFAVRRLVTRLYMLKKKAALAEALRRLRE